MSRISSKSRVSRSSWPDGDARLLAPLVLRQDRGVEIADRRADRRQRRAQIVAERGEERRRQLGPLPRQLGAAPLLEELRALERDRDDAGDGVARAGLERPPARREQADRAWRRCAPAPARSARSPTPPRDGRRRTASARRTRSRPTPPRTRDRDRGVARSAAPRRRRVGRSSRRPAAGTQIATMSSSNRRATCRAIAASAPSRSVVSRMSRVRSNSRVSSLRRSSASCALRARRRRQPAGDDADDEKGDQRDPVVRIGDGEACRPAAGRSS